MADTPDNDLAVPSFLVRTPENTPKSTRLANPWKWETTPAMKAKAAKDAIKAARVAACEPVLLAVLANHSTVGQIKKETALETKLIQQALKMLIKRRAVAKLGRQYLPF